MREAVPLVSVVMPVRDAGAFLREAVDSILAQSLRELELLVVDDGSSDGAVGGLERGDDRLRILPSNGRGVVDAFRTGLEAARGAFVARMDADDIALQDRCAQQLAYLRDHPEVGIAGGCVEIFSAEGTFEGNRRYAHWLNSLRAPDEIRAQLFVESPIPNPTAFFRKSVLERLGGYRDPEWPEDYDLYLRADAAGIAMGKPERVVLRWRDHSGRLTRSDSRYSLDSFQRAKAHHLVRDRLRGRGIVLWGAGPTGRRMHDLIVAEGGTVVGFLEVHPRRIGGEKRGLPVWAVEKINEPDFPLVLVAVGARGARDEIRSYLETREKVEGEDFLFVS